MVSPHRSIALRVVPPPAPAPAAGELASDEAVELQRDIPLEELYRRYAPYVAAIVSRILGREGEVQDVVQDVFASAVRGLRRRDELVPVRSWLAKVAVRSSLKQLRRRALWSLLDLAESPHYE